MGLGSVNVPGGSGNATEVGYNNTSSGLSASNTQDAIDELASMLGVHVVGHTIYLSAAFSAANHTVTFNS